MWEELLTLTQPDQKENNQPILYFTYNSKERGMVLCSIGYFEGNHQKSLQQEWLFQNLGGFHQYQDQMQDSQQEEITEDYDPTAFLQV